MTAALRSTPRPLWLALGLGACFALLAAPGCSRQPEGERCSLANGNDDCDGGDDGELVCTSASSLKLGASDGVSRCCPKNATPTDERCVGRIGGGTGGSTGSGGSGAGGEGGESSGTGGLTGLGDACQYTSDCEAPLVCGPTALCQYECQTDRDCASGATCSADRQCVQP